MVMTDEISDEHMEKFQRVAKAAEELMEAVGDLPMSLLMGMADTPDEMAAVLKGFEGMKGIATGLELFRAIAKERDNG